MKKIFGLLLILVTLVAGAAVADAQQAAKVSRIGFVSSSGDPRAPGPLVEAFRQRLRDLGYIEGKNILVEYRHAEGKLDRIPGLVAELVRMKVDALVVSSVPAIRAARRETKTIPVVMVISVDPVATGIVDSLARPGGNITGIASLARDLREKGLDVLRGMVPEISRIGVLWNADGRASAVAFKEYQAATRAKKIKLQSLEVRGSTPDLEGAFKAAVKERAGALITVSNPVLARYPKRIAELAIKNRLPSMSERSEYVEAGGLMDYSADYAENFRHVAAYVDKILKGTKPADLPVEKQNKFELVINLKTAKQIGLTIPPEVLMRADKVIK